MNYTFGWERVKWANVSSGNETGRNWVTCKLQNSYYFDAAWRKVQQSVSFFLDEYLFLYFFIYLFIYSFIYFNPIQTGAGGVGSLNFEVVYWIS